MKKIFYTIITIILFCFLSLSVACDNNEKHDQIWSEGLSYSLNEDGESYIVNGLGDCVDPNVYIPPTYKGLPVTTLSGFSNIDTRFRLYLPDSITKISKGSFYESNGLVALNFGAGVKNIEFDICNFGSTPSIYFEGTLEEWCEINIEPYGFGKNMHINGELVTDLTIPQTITTVNAHTFNSFTEVTKITIPSQITKIENGAFTKCSNVTEFYFEDSNATWEVNYYGTKLNFSVEELHNGKAYEYLIGGSGPNRTGYMFTKIS